MPELPEIEIVKRSLFKKVNNAQITNVRISNRNLRYKIPANLPKDITNKKILKITRRSKYLLLHFKKIFLLVHFGMSGKFFISRVKDNKMFKTSFYYDLNFLKKHNHIYLTLNNGLVLIYNDIRKFGFFKIYKNSDIKKVSHLNKLGPEPLSKLFNTNYFAKFIKDKNKNIKNLLMDQSFVSGLGNIYVNEILFLSKIHPLRPCSNLKKMEVKKIIENTKEILKISIYRGGSSIKDFTNVYGKTGGFQEYFKVYGKKNEKCSRISCDGLIKKISISNRSCFFCEKCQN